MRKIAALLAVFVLIAFSPAVAGDADKDASDVRAVADEGATKKVALTGFITDSYCGAANANIEGKACALACHKKGAVLQLYSDEKLYTLDKVDDPESKLGAEVKVTGMLDEETKMIKVASIELVKKG